MFVYHRRVWIDTVFKNLLLIKQRSFSAPAYTNRVGREPLVYRNLAQQLKRAVEKFGHHPAVISCHEKKELSFAEAYAEAEILAVKLKELGLERGDHLGVWATNSTQWYLTLLAAALGGYPLVCMNPAWQAPEVEYALQKAKVTGLVTMDECGKQNFRAILNQLIPGQGKTPIISKDFPKLRAIIMTSQKNSNEFTNFNELLNSPIPSERMEDLRMQIHKIPVESPSNIQFTSGTTGKSKATLLTHFNLVNQGYYFGTCLDMDKMYQRVCLPLPLFHVFGLSVAITAINYGSTIVLPSASFNGAAAIEAIEKEHCNIILGTPTMFVDMLEAQRRLNKSMDSLNIGLTGGAACSPEIYHQAKSVFGLKSMRIGYGLSESSAAIFSHDGSEVDGDAEKSVGKICGHGEAKIINAQDETVSFGETGELCVRGFFNMIGYFEDEERTKEVLSVDGWLKTGDQFMMHSDGTAYVMGRKKDVIIRGGENIFPKEIEDFLDTNDRILEAQIIGVPDKRTGEEICVYIRLKPNTPRLTIEDIRTFCKGKLAHFKIPRYLRIVDEFPKTNSGKIQKFKLREMFQHED